MGKAGGILGIIAGLLGIGAALFTLLVGGLGTAFDAEGASTVIGLGWGGVLFSLLVIIFGAIAFAKPRGAGIGLIACSLGGMVLGGTFVAIVLVLSLVGGLLAMFEKETGRVLPDSVAAEVGALAQSQDRPWSGGVMAFFAALSILIPLVGLGVGIRGLFSDAKRKQGVLLLFLGLASAFIFGLLVMKSPTTSQFVSPDDTFLSSELMVRPGISELGLTVGQFVELLRLSVMDNGKSPQLKGWTKRQNEYTLHVETKVPAELKFTHLLQPPIGGRASLLAPVQAGFEQVPALQFVMSVIATVPSPAISPTPQTPAPSSPSNGSNSSGAATQVLERFDVCVEQKIASFRRESGDDVLIRNDMLEEWGQECRAAGTSVDSPKE